MIFKKSRVGFFLLFFVLVHLTTKNECAILNRILKKAMTEISVALGNGFKESS